jgi:hypothetical protein
MTFVAQYKLHLKRNIIRCFLEMNTKHASRSNPITRFDVILSLLLQVTNSNYHAI